MARKRHDYHLRRTFETRRSRVIQNRFFSRTLLFALHASLDACFSSSESFQNSYSDKSASHSNFLFTRIQESLVKPVAVTHDLRLRVSSVSGLRVTWEAEYKSVLRISTTRLDWSGG